MKVNPAVLEKRAVKAGVKASKKLHHVVTPEELLALRVQTWPAGLRVLVCIIGTLLLLGAWFGWPLEGGLARFFEGIGGVLLVLFGIFGVKRTLSNLVDGLGNAVDAGELVGAIIEGVAEVAGSVIDL